MTVRAFSHVDSLTLISPFTFIADPLTSAATDDSDTLLPLFILGDNVGWEMVESVFENAIVCVQVMKV